VDKFWEFLGTVIIKLIDKLNIFIILLLMFALGYMNKDDIWLWLDKLTQMTATILP
jgi:hypothetical protein